MSFVDRKEEMEYLNDEYKKNEPSLIIVYGRRRNGKTTLIQEFLKNKKGIYFLATEESENINIENFKNLILQKYPSKYNLKIKKWDDLFKYIIDNEKKPVIVIDEFQYLGMNNKAFPSVMQRIWDTNLSKTKAKVILCGSLIHIMEEQTLNYSSPLYGRRTGQIKLNQIPYTYFKDFFKTSRSNLMEFYSITGGVPRYINIFNKVKNIYDGINELILNKNSFLYDEPEFLLKKEVKEIGNYFSLLKVIAEGASKISEISSKILIKQTSLTFYLNTLQDLEIIEREVPVTEEKPTKSKKGLYKIKDNFINFWFKFVYPYKDQLEIGNTKYVLEIIKKNLKDRHISYVYEDICRQSLLSDKKLKLNKIGRWWDANTEIDMVGFNKEEKIIIYGECKYKNVKVTKSVLDELIKKSEKIKGYDSYRKYYILFSISGFDQKLIDYASKNKNIILR